jgi:peptidoglycan/xylan/chitin deacetylase (PgdA/CDA1 family)
LWTVDAYDWQDGMTVAQAQERVMTAVKKQAGGSIVALHAGYDITPELITTLAEQLKTEGYEIVTLATLLNP